jgi:hypothetical protein
MASVKVNRGMPRPEAPASSLPKDQWRDLAIVRELWAKSQLPFDCRLLKQVAADAPLMAPELGYDSVESFLKQELQLDPDLVNRVVGWLEQEQPTGAISLEEVEAAIGSHGGDRRSAQAREDQGDNGTLKRGSNSAAYLQARLRRDAPEVADALERGEIKSARAAAIEAGIITPFPSLQLKDPAPTAQKLLAKKGKAWCLQLLEELSGLLEEPVSE